MSTGHEMGEIQIQLLDEPQPYRMQCGSSTLGLPSFQAVIMLRGPEDLISLRLLLVGYIVATLSPYNVPCNSSRLTKAGLGSKPCRRISGIYCQDRKCNCQ
jgi:hypothetical protein